MHQFWFSTSNLCFMNPYIVISPKYNSTLIYVCFKIWIWKGCYDAISKHLNVLRTGTLAIWNKIYRLSNLHGGIIPLIFARGSQVYLRLKHQMIWSKFISFVHTYTHLYHCPASRTTLVATRFRVAVICPIIQVPHCIRVFFYFVWFVFINHIFQFYYELCTYCNILDIYLS